MSMHIKTILLPPGLGAIFIGKFEGKGEYMVLPYLEIQYLVLPYMVLCNADKQYIVDLESFVSKTVIIYKINVLKCN